MHKQLLNEMTITFSISPAGPILIKASESGADPTLPDMEFVRTDSPKGRSVYLPGSSLKGAIRAHCEKIARTLDERSRDHKFPPLSCNPVGESKERGTSQYACSQYFVEHKEEGDSARIFRESCFVCQMFGHTALASRVRFADAYPMKIEDVVTEERNGVAIDRVFGSVAVGPFNYETVIKGEFASTLYLKNFTLAQVGLLALALRDLRDQRLRIGFGKSRGLGQVEFAIKQVEVRYPMGALLGDGLIPDGHLVGVGKFPNLDGYGYPPDDSVEVSGLTWQKDGWGGLAATIEREEVTYEIWKRGVEAWAREVKRHNERK